MIIKRIKMSAYILLGRFTVKRIALFLILITLFSVICVGCSSLTLVTPDGLSLEYNVLSWNRVENASGYVVTVNEDEYTTHANFLELSLANNADYTIRVKAIGSGKYKNSDYSEPLVFKNTQNGDLTRLSSPSILVIDGQGNIFWSLVGSSNGYRIFKNNVLHLTINDKYTTSCALNITDPGTYSIQIQAIGDGVVYSDSAKSNVYKFVVDNSGKPEMPSLSAPTISYDHETQTINWIKVRYAVGYFVFLNDVVVARIDSTSQNEYSYRVDPNQTSNVYTVTALGDDVSYGMSKKSNSIVFPLVPSNPPENLRIEVIDGAPTITWDSVAYCTGYKVELNDRTETVLTNSLKLNGYADGEYAVRVMATGDNLLYTSTAYGNQITVKVENGQIALPTLSAPDYPRFINNVLYWNASEYAEKYQIIVETPYDDTVSTLTFTTSETSIAIDEVFKDTVMIFYVKAIADGFVSSPYSYGAGYIPPAEKRYIDDQGFEVIIKRDQYYFVQTPVDIVYDGNYLSWSASEYASEYVVTIDGIDYISESNTFEYKIRGTSIVSVSALTTKDKYYQSPRSLETIIVCPRPLDTPEPTLEKYTLSWETVRNASGYLLYINGESVEVASTIINLKTLITVDGVYSLSVVAVAKESDLYTNSLKSREFLYTVDYGEYGTEEKPFLIESYEDFSLTVENPTAYFKINVSEIDLANIEIEPLFYEKSFVGHIDGNGAVIKNFKIKSKNGVGGFFGLLGECSITNLSFENAIAVGNSPIIASYASGVTIDNAKATGIVLLSKNASNVGGLFGTFEGTARNVVVSVQIISEESQSLNGVVLGGFAGVVNGILENITVYGSIDLQSDNSYIGALAGELNATVNTLKINSFVVKAGSGYVGLVSGVAISDISGAAVVGSVTTSGGNAGVFGSFSGSFSGNSQIDLNVSSVGRSNAGGFAGTLNNARVEGSQLSVIFVKASTVYVGGFAGYAYGTVTFDSVGNIDMTIESNVGYVGGLFGYYAGSVEKTVDGNIVLNVSDDVDVNILIGSVIGNRNDKCLGSSVSLDGNGVSRLFSVPKGSGTESDPFVIANAEDTLYFEKYPAAYFVLSSDVDLENRGYFSKTEFSGVLDGKGYAVGSIFAKGEFAGLFAKLNGATVSNLILNDVDCEGQVVGALAGNAVNSTIRGVVANGRIVAIENIAGGLVGKLENCIVERCGFNGDIVCVSFVDAFVGGFAAIIESSSIENCYAIVDFSGLNEGSFAGFAVVSSGNVSRSYAVGKFMIDATSFAGFVLENAGNIEYCYSAFDSYKPFYAFVGQGNGVVSCKFVLPTFVSALNDTIEGLSVVDVDEVAANGIFDGWDNSKGYSLIENLSGQTVESVYSDLIFETKDVLTVNVFEKLSFENLSSFGVGKVTLVNGVTNENGSFAFADYGEYVIDVSYVDFSFTIKFVLEKTINPDFEGNGTAITPYIVTTFEQLKKAASYPFGIYFALDSDIEFKETLQNFYGTIDGKNHKISAKQTAFLSFSGELSNATVILSEKAIFSETADGLTMTAVNFTINSSIDCENVGIISIAENSTFDGITISGTLNGNGKYFGGLVAKLGNFCSVTDVTLSLTMTGTSDFVGGITGLSNSKISEVYGEIVFENLTASALGGIAGESHSEINSVDITVNANEGVIAARFGGAVATSVATVKDVTTRINIQIDSVGILGGVVGSGIGVENCVAKGTIILNAVGSETFVGGIAGRVSDVSGEFEGSISVRLSSSIAFIGLAVGASSSAIVKASGELSVGSTDTESCVAFIGGGVGQGNASESVIDIVFKSVSLSDNSICYIGGIAGNGKVENSTVNLTVAKSAVTAKSYLGGAVGRCDSIVSGNTITGSVETDENTSAGTLAGSCDEDKQTLLSDDNDVTLTINGVVNANKIGFVVSNTTSE